MAIVSASMSWSVVVLGAIVFSSSALPPPPPPTTTSSTPDDVDTTTVDRVSTSAESETSLQSQELPRILNRSANGRLPPECSSGTLCVPKCCPWGLTLTKKGCQPTNIPFDPLVAISGTEGKDLSEMDRNDYFLLVGKPCTPLYVMYYEETDFWSNGILTIYDSPNSNNYTVKDLSQYCLEYTEKDRLSFICDDSKDRISVGFTSWLYTFGLLLSVSCLILILIIYLALETLRDLHGKSLICHVGSLAVSYIMLASVQMSGESGFGIEICRTVAFAIQYSLLSSYLWLHVMCLDSLWAVLEATGHSPVPYPRAKKWIFAPNRGQWVTGFSLEVDEEKEQQKRIEEKKFERRVFAIYFIYVNVLSLMPVMMVSLKGLSPIIPYTYLDQNLKLHNCVFDHDTALHYFYPIPAFITLMNVVIFIVIVIYAVPFQWNASGPHRVPKQKARMCFLLFAIMSSNWIIDMVCWGLGGRQFAWVMLHAFYILQGLISFIIFVFEERVKDRVIHHLIPQIRRVNRKYGCCNKTPVHEDEETALRNPTTSYVHQPMGWVVPK